MKSEVRALMKTMKRGVASNRPTASDFLSTGCTLLNLAASDRPFGGFAKGRYYFCVGDSSSGKTFLSLTCGAEATLNPHFKDYEIYYDDVEGGALMNIESFFGPKLAKRLSSPPRGNSATIEDFYYNLRAAQKKGKPFIYILDSESALDSDSADGKFEQQMVASDKGAKVAGSYGDGKAKYHSEHMRSAVSKLRDTGSILIVLSQTRDNINAIGWADRKTRGGGKALRFYATLEMWSSVAEKITKRVNGKERQVGMVSKVVFRKNRFTGKDRTVLVTMYHSVGIDDIETNIDFLVEEGHWKERGKEIRAPEFKFHGERADLISKIERKSLERELSLLVGEVWSSIEDKCKVKRKGRYNATSTDEAGTESD